MDYTTFGKTGLRVSVAGLGCGGFSRLGLATGKSDADAIALVRLAMDHGVNLFDTARTYNTEHILGAAVKQVRRDEVVIATKGYLHQGVDLLPASVIAENLELSLKALGTDYIDVFQLHAPPPATYDHLVEIALPLLRKAKEAGKIRHIGLSGIAADHHHELLLRATELEDVEVMLIAFHMMHQTANNGLLKKTQEKNIGTHIMYAVRSMFARPEVLRETFAALAAAGQVDPALAAKDNPLDFLLHECGASNLTEAAYRFVRHEPGVNAVLFGTGNPHHVAANVEAILKPPLPAADLDRMRSLFGHLEGVGLQSPPWRIGKDGRPPEIPGGNSATPART